MRALLVPLFTITLASVTGLLLASDAMNSAAELARDARARAQDVQIDLHPQLFEKEKVKALAEAGRARGHSEMDRLKNQGIFGVDANDPRLSRKTEGGPGKTQEPVAGRVVVALSASMPETMLQDYLRQLAGKPESLVVFRGFVGGAQRVTPTARFLEKLRRIDPGSRDRGHHNVETVVDPILFAQLEIDRVPAVAYLHGVTEVAHCDDEDFSNAVVVFGAVSVEAALKKAAEVGADIPAAILNKFRSTGWEQAKP